MWVVLSLLWAPAIAHNNEEIPSNGPVQVVGRQLMVHTYSATNPFIIRGVGYLPTPIGDYSSSGEDYVTRKYSQLYDRDIPLLRQAGVNTIRIWRWNPEADHSHFLDRCWNRGWNPIYVIAPFSWSVEETPLDDTYSRDRVVNQFARMVTAHKDHPSILMWMVADDVSDGTLDDESLFSLIDLLSITAQQVEGTTYHPVMASIAPTDDTVGLIRRRDGLCPHLHVWGITSNSAVMDTLIVEASTVTSKAVLIVDFGAPSYDFETRKEYSNDKQQPLESNFQAAFAVNRWQLILSQINLTLGGCWVNFADEWDRCVDGKPDEHDTCNEARNEWSGLVAIAKNPHVDESPDIVSDIVSPKRVYYELSKLWSHNLVQTPPDSYYRNSSTLTIILWVMVCVLVALMAYASKFIISWCLLRAKHRSGEPDREKKHTSSCSSSGIGSRDAEVGDHSPEITTVGDRAIPLAMGTPSRTTNPPHVVVPIDLDIRGIKRERERDRDHHSHTSEVSRELSISSRDLSLSPGPVTRPGPDATSTSGDEMEPPLSVVLRKATGSAKHPH